MNYSEYKKKIRGKLKFGTLPELDLDEAVFLRKKPFLLILNKTVHIVSTKECEIKINTR